MLTAEQNDELTQVEAGHADGRGAAPLLVPRRVHPRAGRVPGQARRAARRVLRALALSRRAATGSSPSRARTGRRRWPTAWSRPTGCAARTTAGSSTPRARASTSPPSGTNTNFQNRVRATAGQGRGAGRARLGLRRARPGAAAAALRHLRDGRLPRHRLGRPAVQLRPDHGERGRPAPRRVAARALLRVHRPARGLHRARVVRQGAHQDRLHAVRVGDHQAPGAQGRHRGERRLEGRAPAGLPVQHAGRRRGRAPDADPGADQPDHHPVHALHRAQPGRLRARRAAADPRLPDPGARRSTAGTSPTTSRARTSWPG